MTFTVRADTGEIEQRLASLESRVQRTAMARALKRTATFARTRMARAIAKDTGLKVGDVNREIQTSIDVDLGSARVSTQGYPIPLIAFQARGPEPSRGRGRGVTAKTVPGGGRRRYPHAFIATVTGPLPSGVVSPGHRGVFERRGKARLPIKQKYGPSIAHVFRNLVPTIQDEAVDVLVRNLDHELQYALSQGG